MSGNIHITSFEALRRLEAVLGFFSEEVTDKIQSIGRNMENQLAGIENRCQELEREIGYWESEYEQADDEEDDTNYLAYKRQEAEEKLRQAQNLQRQAEEASENFARCARRVSVIADERINEARAFLRQKINELQDYTSLSIDDVVSPVSSPVSANSLSSEENEIEKRINESETDWLKAEGSEKSKFGLVFGKFAHERYEEKIREYENLSGRKERKNLEERGDYGIEFGLKHPDGRNVFYDYVDFAENTIIDYKSAQIGQTEENVAKKNAQQRRRHIEAYEFNFGVTPIYRYETYQSTVNLYTETGQDLEK